MPPLNPYVQTSEYYNLEIFQDSTCCCPLPLFSLCHRQPSSLPWTVALTTSAHLPAFILASFNLCSQKWQPEGSLQKVNQTVVYSPSFQIPALAFHFTQSKGQVLMVPSTVCPLLRICCSFPFPLDSSMWASFQVLGIFRHALSSKPLHFLVFLSRLLFS